MDRMIFINIPVADLSTSLAFYEAVGGVQNRQFSDETTAMVSFSPTIAVMLVTHARWATFTDRPLAAKGASEYGLCLTAESREAVDAWIETAVKAGGRADPNPVQDHGFMYSRGFTDPDDHVWETVWMDPAVVAGADPQAA